MPTRIPEAPEVGTWLGAGTAQLALGIREKPDPGEVSLHCYDRWRATPLEAEAAARWGVRLSVGEDTLPRTRRTLEPFNVPVRFHKGDILQSCWDGGPISVYVDDAAKSPREFCHMLLTFGPSWVPGQTVLVLMDYNFWKKTALSRTNVRSILSKPTAPLSSQSHTQVLQSRRVSPCFAIRSRSMPSGIPTSETSGISGFI